MDRGEVCVGVERCGLEGFRKGGEDFIYLFFFFQRERKRVKFVGISNERKFIR